MDGEKSRPVKFRLGSDEFLSRGAVATGVSADNDDGEVFLPDAKPPLSDKDRQDLAAQIRLQKTWHRTDPLPAAAAAKSSTESQDFEDMMREMRALLDEPIDEPVAKKSGADDKDPLASTSVLPNQNPPPTTVKRKKILQIVDPKVNTHSGKQ